MTTLSANTSATDWSLLEVMVDPFGKLLANWPGQRPVSVEAVRSFPWSAPESHLVLVDGNGHEWAQIPSIALLSPSARQVIEQHLAQRDFVPEITRIVSSQPLSPPCKWTVETTAGPTEIEVVSIDEVRRLDTNGVLLSDANGLRFRIPDQKQLDAHSQAILVRYL
ncbi:MAG: DUF1854 domain-containing protein [Planctomyces sp.]|nr:DUF1854 domain-containing protein [Planctomyces sp.]